MKARLFTNDNGIAFFAELREQSDAYFKENGISRTGDNRMRVKIIVFFTLVILTYVNLLMSPSIWMYALNYFFFGLAVLLVFFNIAHDAAHDVAVKNRRLNRFLFLVSFQFLGQNPFLWGKNHTQSHHMYPNVEESDVDVLNVFGMRVTDTAELKWFHRYQHVYVPLYYLFYSINWLFFRNILSMFNYTARTISTRITPTETIWLLCFKACFFFYMLILPILILPFNGWSILLVFLCAQMLISLVVLSVLIISHLSDYVIHPTADESNNLNVSWAKMQLTTCIDYGVDSRFFRWTLGGFNTHAVHHLFPDVSHVHHRVLIPMVRELAKKHEIDYIELSYMEALRSHFRFLKKMGTPEPDIPIAYPRKDSYRMGA
jgi:linoleoyl-CoA desaturase